MKKTDSDAGRHAAGLDQLIVEITTDAHGDDEQLPERVVAPTPRKRQRKVAAADLALGHRIELIVLSIKESAARCRLLSSDHTPATSSSTTGRRMRSGTTRSVSASASDPWPGISMAFLPWRHIDNRSFLRCPRGYGLCLSRLSRFQEAERVFDRMLWLNPSDNQGVGSQIDEVRAKTAWEDREESLKP